MLGELESSGLIIELRKKAPFYGGCRVYITYSACTHGGWAKYIGVPNATSEPVANFETKNEIIADANSVAKYYNETLEVSV
jgi:hypothetical protein